MLGPNFSTPEPPVKDVWIADQEPKIIRESADFGTWWAAFNDPVLDSLIETARDQNLTLQISGIRILEARARLGIAVGSQYPQRQALTADYRRFRQSEKQTLMNTWEIVLSLRKSKKEKGTLKSK